MPLRLDSRPVGDVMVVQCDGRIVAGAEVHALQLYLRRLLLQHHDVVLQLERVDFVDSSGLGALVRLVSTARTNAGEIRLCALQPPVRRILELTKLLGLFEVYDSEAEAIIAAYLGSRYSRNDSGEQHLRILCVYDSVDVRTLLGEVLCRAGYKAVTAANMHDAQILLKATKAKLIVLGANLQLVHGVPAKQAIAEIDPTVSLVVLDEDFAAQNPGEAATKLLETIRSCTAQVG
jgi:anti-sigma B factor antagonist